MVRRRLLWLALVVYAVLGMVLTLVPFNPLDPGFRDWRLDRPVNFVMFMPPVVVVLLLDRRIRAWWPVVLVAVLSAGIEVVQATSPRDSSLLDWVLNTSGAALAAAVVALYRRGSRGTPIRRLET
jgi:glycopeptide antibiotics resistance protein